MSIALLKEVKRSEDWRTSFYEFVNSRLDKIEKEYPMENLGDISRAIFQERSEILGRLIQGFIEKKFDHLLNQQVSNCPKCGNQIITQGKRPKNIQTLAGSFELLRPYFYCRDCHIGSYPLDEVLCLSSSSKQYDIQDVEAWLSSEMPYEMARETFERVTGEKQSEHHMYDTVNAIGQELNILDVCPDKEEINHKIAEMSEGKFRRPILMIAIDGAHAPTRPEPSPHPRKGKRGKGQWKEVKGFRLYLLDTKSTIHLISWHQVCTDQELAENLLKIKESGLIPESKVRLCLIGDGAAWIWNRGKEIFPSAKEVLDYYHCSEYVYAAANAHYGKGTQDAQAWSEAILTRIYWGYHNDVLSELKEIKSESEEAREKIDDLYNYLFNHRDKMNYSSAKRAGYHIGSGAIETANKFISHTRMKRSGAWWYIKNANNMLKIRCAKYNGTYDNVIEKYKINDQKRINDKKFNRTLKIIQ